MPESTASGTAAAEGLQEALLLHRSGQLEAAEKLYRQMLTRQEPKPELLHLLAVCRHGRGDFIEAANLLQAALAMRPDDAGLHLSRGNVWRETGHLSQAAACYERAAQLAPGMPAAHFNLATTWEQAGRMADALTAYEGVLALGANADALTGRGNCLLALGRLHEAVQAYQIAVQLDPKQAVAHANLGAILVQLGRSAEAMAALQQAIMLRPDNAGAWLNRAGVLNDMGRPGDALREIDHALSRGVAPTSRLLHQRARALWSLQRSQEAIAALEQALLLASGNAVPAMGATPAPPPFDRAPPEDGAQWMIRFDLAGALAWEHERVAEVRAHLDILDAQRPDDAAVTQIRGLACFTLGEYAQARGYFEQARAAYVKEPGGLMVGMADFNLGLLNLLEGRWAEGWHGYQWRWHDPYNKAHQRDFAQAIWLGGAAWKQHAPGASVHSGRIDDDISGATLLVHAEQGFGDSLQFCRYVPLLIGRARRVLFEVPGPLVSLMRRSLPGEIQILAFGEPLPAFDRHVPLLSLPLALQITPDDPPATGAYLRADENRVSNWRQRLAGAPLVRIGLTWSGNPAHRKDRDRSLQLARLQPALERFCALVPDVEILALQNRATPADRGTLSRLPKVRFFGDGLGDFDDTAALVQLCDLVIGVDTAGIHLAAAMGRPVWALIPFVPDFRWQLGRADSPWYPGMRLFRQPALGQWDGALQELEQALLAFGKECLP